MSRRASYGIDAPGVPFGLGAGGVLLGVVAIVNAAIPLGPWGVLGPILGSLVLLGSAGLYLHTTLRGKFRVWSGLLGELDLQGDELVLDLGCGRGAVLIAVAKRLSRGGAIGVDRGGRLISPVGWRFWYGGRGWPPRLVTARKPGG